MKIRRRKFATANQAIFPLFFDFIFAFKLSKLDPKLGISRFITKSRKKVLKKVEGNTCYFPGILLKIYSIH